MGDAATGRPELRVLEVFHTLGIGGAETWLLALLRYFRRARDTLPYDLRIDVCLTGGVEGPLDEEVRQLGARLHYLGYRARSLLNFARKYRSLLRNGGYHVLHDHQDHSAGLRLLLAGRYAPPVRAVHFHNPLLMRQTYETGPLRRASARFGYALVRRRATHILGTSLHTLKEHGVGPGSVSPAIVSRALHCGVDVDAFRGDVADARRRVRAEFGFAPEDPVLLFVGRLHSHIINQKNPMFALHLAAEAISRDRRIRLLLAGAGAEVRPELSEFIRQRELGDSIKLIGPRSDVPRLMLGSDLLLLPSLAEGLGMVAVEAQSCGLPVLASDVTPREASVIPGMVVFLPLWAGVPAWAEEVQRILARSRPDSRVSNAAIRASAFSIANSAAALLAIYVQGLPARLRQRCD